MVRRIVAVWVTLAMFMGMIVISIEFTPPARATTIYVDDDGGVDYEKIQDAINASNDGDTVFVYNGIYNEIIIINKTITLMGQDKNTTIIHGDSTQTVIDIKASWVNITGFTITNGSTGINIQEFSNNSIENNYISSTGQGINILYSRDNNISGNNISDSDDGVNSYMSNRNIISGNVFFYNRGGIHHYKCNNDSLYGNIVIDCHSFGFRLMSSADYTFSNNYLENNDRGLSLRDSVRITIEGNNMIKNGIYIDFDSDSIEYWNTHEIDTSNSVNGKPVYYWKNRVGGTVPVGAGQIILANCTNVRIENQVLPNITRSLNIGYSSENDIINCSGENESLIIYLYSSHENNLVGNHADIYMRYCDNNSLNNNIVNGIWMGIYLTYCNGNDISDNYAGDTNNGIVIYKSHNNTISRNNVSSSVQDGISLYYSNGNHIIGNNASDCGENGIYLEYSDLNIIESNNVSGNYYGINLFWSMTNNITNNRVFSNEGHGIYLGAAYGGNVTGNEVFSNDYNGIDNHYSHRNFFFNNYCYDNMYGLNVFQSENNIIVSNNFTRNHDKGIHLYYSPHTHIAGNNFDENGIFVIGDSIEHWMTQYIDTTNVINGKPVYFWKNQTGGIVPEGAGQIFLVNCSSVLIENQNIEQSTLGIMLVNSSDIKIKSNNITYCSEYGIYLFHSYINEIIDNNITGSDYGIYFISSDDCNISLNIIYDNYFGINIEYSNDNLITENVLLSNNFYSFQLKSSSYNYIYHNDIVSASPWIVGDDDVNYWDNGYPSGGNFWERYNGVDEYSGPNQDQPGSDGIGDIPYYIDVDSQDDYPFMEPIFLDTTPPQIISGPDVISISATSAIIEWVTDEASDSIVEYGLTQSYGSNMANNSFVIDHSINLTGLTPETQYHFRVRSKDSEGTEVISGDYTFTTSSDKPVHNIDKNTYYYGIQEAIDDADPGNTIFVSSGIYQENVVIDRAINLTGEDRNNTIIDGGGVGDVVRITADWVNVSGFTMNNSGGLVFPDYDAGVDLSNIQNCSIINNKFFDNKFGMLLSSSTNNVIKDNIATLNSMDGILMISSTHNQIINNNGSSNNRDGFYLSASSNNNIAGNILNSNHQNGIYAYISSYNVLDNNELSLNKEHGIQISDSSNTTIISNYIYSNSNYGIYHYYSSNATLVDNEFINDGIVLEGSQVSHYNSHTIPDNNLVNGKPLYYYKNCIDITIDGSTIDAGELILANCSEVIIRNVHISGTDVGIEFGFTSNTTLKNCNLSFNNFHGIILLYSSYNNVEDNEIVWNSENGINLLEQSNNNKVISNSVSNNEYGIYILRSSNNNVSYNNIFSNTNGIVLETSLSNYNIIEGNNVSKNGGGINLYWATNRNNIIDNTIWMNTFFGIALDWASNNNITGNDVKHSWNGIILTSPSVNNVIQGNNVSNNEKGISLISISTNNNIIKDNNVFSNNASNIDFTSSSDNILENNTISNSRHGIILSSSLNNIISGNNVFENEYAINLSSSSNNRIYHNNFIDNQNQVFDDRGDNYWDDGYPSGGNYWSDYSGVDDFNGPNQDISGSDLIGDTPYSIDSDSLDYYPLMNPWGIDSTPPIIELVSPSNNSFIKSGVIFNFSISDENLDVVSYSVNEDPYQTLLSPYNIDTSDWGDDNYIIEVTAVDLSDNINSKWFNFTIDSTLPLLSLVSPDNNSMISADPEIIFSISDANLNQTTYSKNSASPTSFSTPYTINTSSWTDGQYNITVYTDDLAGNINERWFTFTKDTSIPEITLNTPDNESLLMEHTTLDFDVFDENLDVVQYSIDYASPIDFEEPYDIDTTDWEDGEYRITIYVIDLAGHHNEKWFIFRIDTSTPSVLSSSPEDGSSDVSAEPEIIIEFSEPMDCDSVKSAISTDPYIEYSCAWSNDNKTLTLNLTEPLEYETFYQISISTKANDLAGRELDNEYEFGFTTGAEPKNGDEGEFPVLFLLLAIIAVVMVIVIVFLITAKKKKVPGEVVSAQVEAPETIQVTCSNCSNLLSVNDIGTTMNVTCPFCSTLLTVQSQKAQIEQPQLQPQPQPQAQPQIQMQVQQPTIQISCPACKHAFTVMKTGGPTRIQCPNCGTVGTMKP